MTTLVDAGLESQAASPEDQAAAVTERLRARCEAVIDRELARLARRTPALSDGDLRVIEGSLRDLVEGLLLARLRDRPYAAGEVGVLFDMSVAHPGGTCARATPNALASTLDDHVHPPRDDISARKVPCDRHQPRRSDRQPRRETQAP